jgi:hypothetical protein
MRKMLLAAAMSLAVLPAFAVDVATKAKSNFLSATYPATSGFYFGIGTMGGGGNVNASVPGVNANSLVTNEISVNGILGYVWNVPNSQLFAAAEGWFGWTNFNGSAPGFSFSGPATFTQRVMVGVPLSDITALFPTLNLSAPPFPALPNGQTASNVKPYLSAHFTEQDITIDVLGAGSNRDWRFKPGLSVGALGQLTSGSVVDVATVVEFPQRGVCAGAGLPGAQGCGSAGTEYKGLLALKW